MKKILISGSIAYDYLMRYEGDFEECFVHGSTNLALICRGRVTAFGGCGGNIAYTIGLLGGKAAVLGSAGKDFDGYKKRLENLGVDCDFVEIDQNNLTASAFIITDDKQDQVSIFDEGKPEFWKFEEMMNQVKWKNGAWGVVSPDSKERMLEVLKNFVKEKIPFIFDPGRQLGRYNESEIKYGLENATINVLNKHESELVMKRLGIDLKTLVNYSPNFILTDAENGCMIYENGVMIKHVPAVKAAKIVDPTGCGDAFIAGTVWGIVEGKNIVDAVKVGVLCATYVIEHKGTQEHIFGSKDFAERFEKAFGEKL